MSKPLFFFSLLTVLGGCHRAPPALAPPPFTSTAPAVTAPVVHREDAPASMTVEPVPPAPAPATTAFEGPVDAEGDAVAMTPPPALEGLSGACADPYVHRGEKIDPADTFRIDPSGQLDLDGDGQRDVVLFVSAARTAATYALYVHRAGCAHYVGEVDSNIQLQSLRRRRAGLVDLKGISDECASLGGIGHGYCSVVYAFDGKSYRRVSETRTKHDDRSTVPLPSDGLY